MEIAPKGYVLARAHLDNDVAPAPSHAFVTLPSENIIFPGGESCLALRGNLATAAKIPSGSPP
jgi:hypothetical protein